MNEDEPRIRTHDDEDTMKIRAKCRRIKNEKECVNKSKAKKG